MTTQKAEATKTTITIKAADLKTIRKSTASNWKQDIVQYLKAHNGADSLTIYNATRADRLEITDVKKIHNIASQLTYLRDDGYVLQYENKSIYLLAAPTTVKDEYEVLPNMSEKLSSLMSAIK